uniref:Uncharacterized protein n=1 Tax=Terrapene triunguis TaxID=2587831 RepID=A0A674IE89_9SAUR
STHGADQADVLAPLMIPSLLPLQSGEASLPVGLVKGERFLGERLPQQIEVSLEITTTPEMPLSVSPPAKRLLGSESGQLYHVDSSLSAWTSTNHPRWALS